MPSRAQVVLAGGLLTLVLFAKFVFFPGALSDGAGAKFALSELKSWTFVPAEHANIHTLSQSQCVTSFPGLHERIDTTVNQRERGNKLITHDDVQIAPGRCMLQLLIYENELYIVDLGDHLQCYVSNGRERIIATLSLIHRAISSSPEPLPNIEFPLSYDDLPTRSTHGVTWGFTRKENEDNVWLIPDYGYWSWWAIGIPSFNSLARSIAAVDSSTPWKEKSPSAVWRGTPHYAPEIRQRLVEVTEDKSWADVKIVTIGKDEQHFLSLDQHCKYQYLLQTEGTSYSGRFKFLQLCNSVTVSHKLEYAEFATHLMRASGPEQNFVEVKRDWSDLEASMDYYVSHPEKAEAIAERSHKVFAERYLTPAAVSCYLRRLIEGWAKVQGFEPRLYELSKTTGERIARGIPFEAFVVSFPQEKPGEYGRFAPA